MTIMKDMGSEPRVHTGTKLRKLGHGIHEKDIQEI